MKIQKIQADSDYKVASVWDRKAEDYREAAEQLKGSRDVKDIMARATLLRLAEDCESAGRQQRLIGRERGKRP
jgi:hypothetical protein